MPNMMVLVGGALGKYLGHEVRAHKWTSALAKVTPERSLALLSM